MAVEFGWRRFIFFDKNFVADPSGNDKFLGLKDVKVQNWCQSGDMAFFCEPDGGVFRLNSALDVFVWKAFHRTHRTHQDGHDEDGSHHEKDEKRKPIAMTDIKCAQGLLFAIGEDDESGPLLKMWGKMGEEPPELKKTIKLSQAIPGLASTATALGVHSLLTDVAVGFSDGSVIIYQGDVAKDKMSRWTRIREPSGSEGSVEGLAISHLPGDKVVVFVILSNALYSYVIEGKNVVNKVKHISVGATKDCWTFNEGLGQLAIATKEVLNLFDAERSLEVDGGQGRCYSLCRGHEKLQFLWAGEYLALLTKEQALIASSSTNFMSVLTVYDIKGQYSAFSCSLPDLCRMFTLNGILMVSNDKDGTLSELKEKSLSAKLDILFKKKFFDVALSLAKNSKDGQSYLQMIHWKYGDHLYSKGDFDQAIRQYKETIGTLEPSYVMKKFHEENRLQQLCIYLEALHDRKVHNCHQTKILLQTYARLGQKSKLLAFVEKMAEFEEGADLPTAFQIMRDAKMSKEASFLAVKLKLHKEALAMMIEDLGKYTAAVKYIGQQPPEISTPMIEKYGRTLLEHCPNETIQLIYTLLGSYNESDDISRLIAPFLDVLAFQKEFVQFVLTTLPKPKANSLVDSILELRLRKADEGKEPSDSEWEDLFALADAATPEVALQLVRVFRCHPMEHRIMQKSGRWKEFAQFLLKYGELKELIDICKTKGGPDLWQQTVACVARRTDLSDDDIKGFLREMEQAEALHPLQVLEILANSGHLKIAVVKDYVINWLQRMNAKIERDTKAVEANEKRMEEISSSLESLKFEAQVIQQNKCTACATLLQVPAVHFLCRHSFHVHCYESYADTTDRCPSCRNQEQKQQLNENIEEAIDMGQKAEYGKFQNQMNQSVNAIDVLARYMKMGVFDAKPAPPSKHGSATKTAPDSNPFAQALLNETEAPIVERNPLNEPTKRRPTITKRPPAPPRSSASNNPFDEDEPGTSSKNPFEKPSSNNPFESNNPFDE